VPNQGYTESEGYRVRDTQSQRDTQSDIYRVRGIQGQYGVRVMQSQRYTESEGYGARGIQSQSHANGDEPADIMHAVLVVV